MTTRKVREDAIEILRCCADRGLHDSGGWTWTGAIAEDLGYRRGDAAERLADEAWWVASRRVFGLDHPAICLEAAAWLEDGNQP